MGQALYRKYRSKNLSEVIGQEYITQTLNKAIKSGRTSHAYLFSGPRGVGKTSVARILAREINSIKDEGEALHLDVIEIDGASNRGIDEIRDLREKVHIAPTSGKYKIYIIDEAHMLTTPAFNALLKTLEEPPAHCIFILATTELHKMPETIISRTQHFNFKPISSDKVSSHLSTIAKKERIDITPEALMMLAEHGSGSFRDSIGMLDQISSYKSKIDHRKVSEFLGLPPEKSIQILSEAIVNGDSQSVLESLKELRQKAVEPSLVAKHLSKKLRTRLLTGGDDWLAPLLRQLIEVPASNSPEDALEIAVLTAAASRDIPQNETKATVTKQDQVIELSETRASKPTAPRAGLQEFDASDWPQILSSSKLDFPRLYTILRLAKPSYSDGVLTLSFRFDLHRKKMNQAQSLQDLGELIESQTNSKVTIKCRLDKDSTNVSENRSGEMENLYKSRQGDENVDIQAITNIFGTAEMLES